MNYNGIVYNEAVLLAFTNKCMGMLRKKAAFKKCNLQCFPATKIMRNERHRALEYARLKSKVTNKWECCIKSLHLRNVTCSVLRQRRKNYNMRTSEKTKTNL